MNDDATTAGVDATQSDAIARALSAAGIPAATVASGEWEVVLPDGGPIRLRAADDWLLFEAAAREAPADLRDLLRRNAGLPGGVKFVWSPEGFRLRAELPWSGDDAELHLQLMVVCEGFAAAAGGDAAAEPSGLDDTAKRALLEHGTAAGWTVRERTDGSIAIDLDVPGAAVQAQLHAGVGSAVLVAPAASLDGVEANTAAALATLGLRVGAAARMARPTERAGVLTFEVSLGTAPAASQIGHALAALSVACRLGTTAAEGLRGDPALARFYLARADPRPLRTDRVRPITTITQP
jgi:hypothetical protein